MSLARNRRTLARAIVTALIAVSLASFAVEPALAASSTITRQDCVQGRIRDRSGAAVPLSRCEALIGKSVQLAQTGFDAWIVALAGVVCVGGAGVLVLRGRRKTA